MHSALNSITSFFCILAILCMAATGNASVPPEGPVKDPVSSDETSTPSADTFTYELTGRPDPFVPFIEPQVATKLDDIVEEDVELTGMQLFEPGQLKLVAVLFADSNKIAMVEDVTGKGYVIKEGLLIGRHGIVSEINTDKIIITETSRTRAGKETTNTVVMRLNKEGDK